MKGDSDLNRIAVLCQSKYGATKKYAQWLAEELCCDVFGTDRIKAEQLADYDTVILGGGLYATGIAGITFLKKNIGYLAEKRIAVFAVGASPHDEDAINEIKARNLKGALAGIPCFYCRGAWDEDKMSFKDRTLCGMLKKAVAKKDPSAYEPWMKALMEAYGTKHDWTDRKNLEPLLEYIRKGI